MSLVPTDFLGHWTIERKIEDALSGMSSRFEGKAWISRGEAKWDYFETGKLLLAGATPMTAERRYIWKPSADGIDIHFEDGRFFHRLQIGPEPTAQHWCDPDQYDVRYDFSDWPNWQTAWQI